ncbi:MAG: hypothetical protein KF902_14775 [Phycisphaeraceae bacterium]|nr:hypothetical protein [Phycisphaeraceae bacterium]
MRDLRERALPGVGSLSRAAAIVASECNALAVFDDGSGPALYIGTSGDVVRWDGNSMCVPGSPNGLGVSGTVRALTAFDDGSGPALYAGGSFTIAGSVAANRIAKWQGCVPPPRECPPDVNGDGELDILDLLDFMDDFGRGC